MTYASGESGNLNGRPSGRQGFVDRARYLLGKHDVGEILDIAGDEKAFRKLSAYDGMIMRRICEAFTSDGNASMNSLLDRIIGKPVQPIAAKTEVSISQSTLDAMQELKHLPTEALDAIKSIVDGSVTYSVDTEVAKE